MYIDRGDGIIAEPLSYGILVANEIPQPRIYNVSKLQKRFLFPITFVGDDVYKATELDLEIIAKEQDGNIEVFELPRPRMTAELSHVYCSPYLLGVNFHDYCKVKKINGYFYMDRDNDIPRQIRDIIERKQQIIKWGGGNLLEV